MKNLKDCTVVITTFFAGNKLDKCIKNIPEIFNKLIIDNGGGKSKKKYYENKFKNLTYHVSDTNLGVPRSYSLANKLVQTKYMFNTQPDVIIKKNCIENLLEKAQIYPNSAILSPTIFHNKRYIVEGDYRVLKINKKKYTEEGKIMFHSAYQKPPDGDLSVEGVTGTAMLIDRIKLRLINDNRNVRFSLSHGIINSEFIIEKGLNGKNDTISIRLGDRYLHTNNSCCYLYFTKKPEKANTETINKFNKNASSVSYTHLTLPTILPV